MRPWSGTTALTAWTAGAEYRCRRMRPVAAVDVHRSVIDDARETSACRAGPVEDPCDSARRDVDERRGSRSISQAGVPPRAGLCLSVVPVTVGDCGPHDCAAAVLVVLLSQKQILDARDVEHVRDRIKLRRGRGHFERQSVAV